MPAPTPEPTAPADGADARPVDAATTRAASLLPTRFTRRFGCLHPIASAPMALAGGGALAAAVSRAGGLGLIGGGYGDAAWIAAQFEAAGDAPVGIGFITWSLARQPQRLAEALARRPRAVMLSFGDPRPFAEAIHAAGARLICQCQTLDQVQQAIEAGADAVIAQGAEAGGHGLLRGAFSFVPEVADRLAAAAPQVLLLAAGGIADGRGLAAALMLGADGVLMGTRFWAAAEALVAPGHHQAILATDGDGTLRTRVADIVRGLDWPEGYTARIRRNAFTERWHGREAQLAAELASGQDAEARRYREAFAAGDAEHTGVWFGEAAGLVRSIEPAAAIVDRVVDEARRTLLAGLPPVAGSAGRASAAGGPGPVPSAPIELRPAQPDDAESLSVLGLQVYLDTYATSGIRTAIARDARASFTIEAVQADLADAQQAFIVAERAGHLVGYLQLKLGAVHPLAPTDPPGAPCSEIYRLYVQEPFTGTGLGSRLLAASEALAAARGDALVWLTPWAYNRRAIGFYRARGFIDVGPDWYEAEGERHENRVMVKPLPAGPAAAAMPPWPADAQPQAPTAAGAEPPGDETRGGGDDRAFMPSPAEPAPPGPQAGLPLPPADRQAHPRGAVPAPPEAQPVDVTAFAPSEVAHGQRFLLQAFVHAATEAAAAEARQQAAEADAAAVRRGACSLPLDVALGSRIDLRLEWPGLQVDEPDAVLTWRGRTVAAQFELAVPEAAKEAALPGRLRIAVDGVPAGTLRFQVAVKAAAGSGAEPAGAQPLDAQVTRYRKAFVSYSSKDRAEVIKRVQAFRIAGIEVFQDVLSLDPGDRWSQGLWKAIDDCDLFLLFWSSAAKQSEWVGREIAHALARKGGSVDSAAPPEIQPVPIEGPPIPLPPPELGGLHFNDALLAHIAVASASAPAAPRPAAPG